MQKILAGDMVQGRRYKLKDGEIVEHSYEGSTGRMIVHPPGEPDMQSCIALKKTEEVTPVDE